MRGGANSVQHLLTPQALAVLKHAVTEARRKGHPQVQPLHVVAMLLAHAGSRLRQACMLSQPHSSQTPQCRALEVCFNVALDHLAQSALPASCQPVLSNALMAALKRAHAHQRRGCPEHQQSPLLAVKVEIDQLIISILDDPSVSRVMKEAGFSSTNVKFNLEDGSGGAGPIAVSAGHERTSQGPFYGISCLSQEENETKTIAKYPTMASKPANSSGSWQQSDVITEGHDQRKSMLKGSKVQGQVTSPWPREDDIRTIVGILLSPRNRNAILIGETPADANAVVKDLAARIKKGDVPAALQGLQFLDPQLSSSSFGFCSSLEMEQKLAELSKIVGECMPAGAMLHIGDLQWLAEPMQLKKGPSNFCPAQHAAAELGRLLDRHVNERLWFVGVATPPTFARLEARYPPLQAEWGLQPVSIARGPQPSLLIRFANEAPQLRDHPVQACKQQSPMVFPIVSKCSDERSEKMQCCADCLAKFEDECDYVHEHERLSLQLAPAEWSSLTTDGASPIVAIPSQSQVKSQSVVQKLLNLRQKWQDTCRARHAHLHTRVPAHSRLELSPLNRPSGTSGSLHTKPRGPDLYGPGAGSENSSLGLSNPDQLVWMPSSLPAYTLSSSRGGRVSPLASVVQVQDAVSLGAHGSPEAPSGPDIGSPKDGSSVASGPDDQDDHHGSTGTSGQDAFLAPIQTDLALGRLANSQRPPNETTMKLPQIPSVGLSPIGLRNSAKPHWLTQSPLEKERLRDLTMGSAPLRIQGLQWQLSSSQSTKSTLKVSTFPESARMQSPPPSFKEGVADSLKGLYKGLMQRVPWQCNAVAGVAATVMKCRSGMGSMRGATSKTDTWLLLLGPDRVAKHTLAKALAELVFGGEKSFLHLGFAEGSPARLEMEHSGVWFRGRTPLDRLAAAIRMKPNSVVLLEDVDKADSVMQASIVRAMESGKLSESNGREVSISNTIVVMSTSIGGGETPDLVAGSGNLVFSEEKLAALGQCDVRMLIEEMHSDRVIFKGHHKICVVDHGIRQSQAMGEVPRETDVPFWVPKRKVDSSLHPISQEKRSKLGTGGFLCLDLNLAAGESKEEGVGSLEGSQCSWTDNQELDDEEAIHEKALSEVRCVLSNKFCTLLDYAVLLNPYDFKGLADAVLQKLAKSCEDVTPCDVDVEIDIRLLECIVSCVWKMPNGRQAFNTWADDVFLKGITRALMDAPIRDCSVMKLVGAWDVTSVKDAFEGVALPRNIVFGST